MKLCLDLTPLLVNSAGVKTYLYNWAQSLQDAGSENVLQTFPQVRRDPLRHFKRGPGTWPGIAKLVGLNYAPLPIAEWITRSADVFHASNLWRRLPQRPRLTATIHDTTAWLMPEAHTAANCRNEHRFAQLVLRRAHRLIAVSQSTKADALRAIDIDPDRIHVIYPGIPPAYFNTTRADAEHARRRLGLNKPYCLFVGTIEPRKNVMLLLDAWLALDPDIRATFDLVLAGMPGWKSETTLRRLSLLNGSASVRYLGYVPEPLMPGLNAAACALVYPSLYEGFGLPAAQAMAAGTPVLTSHCSSLPEITAGSSLLVDPRSVSEISAAIERLLPDESLRASLAAAGRVRAGLFRWERCAAESWRFFEGALG